MKIIKAKITKDSTLVATYKDENGTTTVEGKNLVTSDLINAFSKLNPHAALLTEQKEVDGIESVDEVPDIIGQVLDVTGYSIGGDGDNEGVTLEEDTANADVQPDAIPEAGTDFNQEVAEFQQAMNDAGVDIIMNGKKIKSRKPRKVKQLAS